jgi:hypothetical protein
MNRLRLRLITAMGVGMTPLLLAECGGMITTPDDGSAGDALAAHDHSSADAKDEVLWTFPDAGGDDADDAPSDVTIIPPMCPWPRRPFLVGEVTRASGIEHRDDWMRELAAVEHLDPTTRQMLAEAWANDGREEHASIAAFARFTMLLLSLGAPHDLVLASQRASIDEIRHARDCFALASRYGGVAIGPGPLEVHDSLEGVRTLREVAILTAEEGCVGETLGVALVEEALAHTTDPEVRRIFERVVKDEIRHAELGWRFVRWAILRDPTIAKDVEETIAAALEKTRATPLADYRITDPAWAAHGRLTPRSAHVAMERAIREVVEPCTRALLSGLTNSDRHAAERIAVS